MKEKWKLFIITTVFLGCFHLPVELLPFRNPVFEALALVKWYAREHVLLCLVPAFLIAGAISVFVSQASVIKYFGAKANKFLSYGVASISGTILAVCSCTVLPIFSGIYKRGAGLGPATAFLYSGPAINILAIILTARILGWQLGAARIIGSIIFSIVVGLLMHFIFIKDERSKRNTGELLAGEEDTSRSLLQDGLYFSAMIGFLVFANWAKPQAGDQGTWNYIYGAKWYISAGFLILTALMLGSWFRKDERTEWVSSSWFFAKQIMPYLFIRSRMKRSIYVMTYFHPRDFDPQLPVLKHLPLRRQIKSRAGLKGAYRKLDRMLRDFDFMNVEQANRVMDWDRVKTIRLD